MEAHQDDTPAWAYRFRTRKKALMRASACGSRKASSAVSGLWRSREGAHACRVFHNRFGVLQGDLIGWPCGKAGALGVPSPRGAYRAADIRKAMTIPNEARAVFDRAIEHTRGLSPATFDQWSGGVQFDDLTDGVLTLRVQN